MHQEQVATNCVLYFLISPSSNEPLSHLLGKRIRCRSVDIRSCKCRCQHVWEKKRHQEAFHSHNTLDSDSHILCDFKRPISEFDPSHIESPDLSQIPLFRALSTTQPIDTASTLLVSCRTSVPLTALPLHSSAPQSAPPPSPTPSPHKPHSPAKPAHQSNSSRHCHSS